MSSKERVYSADASNYKRRLSPIERYYVSCDTLTYPYHTPCLNQMTIEGSGSVDEIAWADAVRKASLANPGSRLILKGSLGFACWIDSGKTTPFRVVEGLDWDGVSNKHAPFLEDPLPAYQGPTSEVLLVKSKCHYYIIFRSHHGVMDGRGTQAFADDVFRVLNGDAPLGENSSMSDLDLSLRLTDERSEMITDEVNAPTGVPEGHEMGRIWYRRTLSGQFSKVLANVAIGIARSARRYSDSKVRVQLPVDMRARIEGLRSTANLSGGIMMNVPDNTTVESWQLMIKKKLADRREAVIPRFMKFMPVRLLCWISLKMMKKANEKLVAKRQMTGRYRSSGIVSNLGLLRVSDYQGGGFKASSIFFIPPDFDTTAFFLTVTGNEKGLELILRVPKVLATRGRLQLALDDVVNQIKAGSANKTVQKQPETNLR